MSIARTGGADVVVVAPVSAIWHVVSDVSAPASGAWPLAMKEGEA